MFVRLDEYANGNQRMDSGVLDSLNPASPDVVAKAAWMKQSVAAWGAERDRLWGIESAWSIGRLVTFLAAASVWYPFRSTWIVAACMPVVCFILFGLAVSRHRRARAARESVDRRLVVAAESKSRLGGFVCVICSGVRPGDGPEATRALPSSFTQSPSFALTEQEQIDVDLYASPCGLFGLLNRCSSVIGARRLRDWLEHPLVDGDAIEARRRCVAWLREQNVARYRLAAGLAAIRGECDRVDRFLGLVAAAVPLSSPGLVLLLRWWSIPSALLVLAAVVAMAMGYAKAWQAVLLLGAVNWAAFYRFRKSIARMLSPLRGLSPTVGAMLQAGVEASDAVDGGKLPPQMRDALQRAGRRDAMPAIGRLMDWADTGGLLHTLLNMFVFYDVHVADSLSRRMVAHREAIFSAAGALADLEAIGSLSAFAWEQPLTCYPKTVDEPQLSIDGGVHPLIPPEQAVANSIALAGGERTWIVSGSNMAGKSTFLRMAAVNVLLAQVGGAVCAQSMTYEPMRLVTDLRIRDDLSKRESYFLAEVRQIRRMLDGDANGVPLLGLIDELFRGTNSSERVASSMALIGHLASSGNLFIVATHEQALIDGAGAIGAVNRHFRESIDATGPVFDYRLRVGPATVRNAIQILAREGFPTEIIARARQIESEGTV